MTIIRALAALGLTIPAIGLVFRIRIERSPAVLEARRDIAGRRISGVTVQPGAAKDLEGVRRNVEAPSAAEAHLPSGHLRQKTVVAATAPLAESKTATRRACRATTDSRVSAAPAVLVAAASAAEDSEAVVVAVDSTVAAEAEDNMTARIFTWTAFAVMVGGAFAQTPQAAAAKPVAAGQPEIAQKKIAQKTFESPEAATDALIDAASKNDVATLKAVLGSTAKGILTSGDPKQDEAERQEFAKIAAEKHHLEKSSMNSHVMVLLIGDQEWPFPIPLFHDGDKWRFDPQRGAMEVRSRQVGANELDAIQACAAFVGVQEAYAAKKRSPAGTVEFAESVANSEVPKEFAEAAGPHPTRPYHGYYFHVLKEQGPNAPGGQHPYMMGKTMMGGFALVAWPANYGVTGIHTFIVNQTGLVYEKDRGTRSSIPPPSYDPDSTWTPVD
jgi:hypothetical protein